MSFKEGIKNVAVGTVKVVGSAALGTVGAASAFVEELGAASGVEIISGLGHGIKSASFNGVRKMWGKEPIEHKHRTGEVLTRNYEMARQRAESQIRYQNQKKE